MSARGGALDCVDHHFVDVDGVRLHGRRWWRQDRHEGGKVLAVFPLRWPARKDDVGAILGAFDGFGHMLHGVGQQHAGGFRLIHRIDKKPCGLVRLAPIFEPPSVFGGERSGNASFAGFFNSQLKAKFPLSEKLAMALIELGGFS